MAKLQQQPQLGVRIGLPEFDHAALHVLVESPDLGDVLRDDRDKHLAAVGRIALAANQARLLQPVDDAGDGAGGQPRDLRQPAGRHPAFQIEEVEAFEVGAGNPDRIGHRLPENHALRGRAPQRVLEFLHQRGPRLRS